MLSHTKDCRGKEAMLVGTTLQIGIHLSCENRSSIDGRRLPLKLVLTGTMDSITLEEVHENSRDGAHQDKTVDVEDARPDELDECDGNLSELEIELLSKPPGKIESSLRSIDYKIRFLPTPVQEKARKVVHNVHQECEKRRAIISRIEDLVKEAYQSGSDELLNAAWVQLVSAMEKWPTSWKRYGFDAFEEASKIGYDKMMLRLVEDPAV